MAVYNNIRAESPRAHQQAIEIVKKSFDPVARIVNADAVDWELRATAVQLIGEFFHPETLPLLVSAASNPDKRVVEQACIALFRLQSALDREDETHQAIQSAYQREQQGTKLSQILRNCLGNYSLSEWLRWQDSVMDVEKAASVSDTADLLVRNGDRRGAVPLYRQAIDLWPYDRTSWLSLGECLIATGSSKDGIDALHFGMQLCPFEAEAFVRLADGYRRVTDLENAEKWFSRVIELAPDVDIMPLEYARRSKARIIEERHRQYHPFQPKTTDDVIKDLIQAIRSRKLVVFCGAGISCNSGLPFVSQFTKAVLNIIKATREEQKLIDQGAIPFESFFGILQENSAVDHLLDIFEGPKADKSTPKISCLSPNTNHLFLAHLMASGLVNTIVTPNFDRLIESALESIGWHESQQYDLYYLEEKPKKDCPHKIFSEIDWESSRPKLIKIHGSVHDKTQLAITMQHVAGKIHIESRKTVIDQIFGACNHTHVLILGYSSSDHFDLSPHIAAISEPDKKVVIIQHTDKVALEKARVNDIREQDYNNPFTNFADSYRVFCDTDALVMSLWEAAFPNTCRGIEKVKGDHFWMPNIDCWHRGLSEAGRHLIVARLLMDVLQARNNPIRLQKAVDAAHRSGDRKQEAFALSLLGYLTHSPSHLWQAIQLGDETQQAESLASLITVYYMRGQIKDAIQCYDQGLSIVTRTKDRLHEGRLHGNLGSLYGNQGQYQQAMDCFNKAVKAARDAGDKMEEGSSLFNLGQEHENIREMAKGTYYYEEALKVLIPYVGHDFPVVKEIKKRLLYWPD